jgi:hypothetical protein
MSKLKLLIFDANTRGYANYVGISRRDAVKVAEEDAEYDVRIEVAYP